jgi:hypothetical protein
MTHAKITRHDTTANVMVNASQAMADACSLDVHHEKTEGDRSRWSPEQFIHLSRALGQALGSP